MGSNVSVIISSYNGASFLPKAYESVLNPTHPIPEITVVDDRSTDKIQEVCDRHPTKYRQDKRIHELIAEQAKRTPEKIAVIFVDAQSSASQRVDQIITYTALNQQANELADYLQKLGVQPNSLVGICVEPSLEMVVGLVGILKAGATYVPIDPYSPAERVEYILDNAQVKVLLTQQRRAEHILAQGASVICLDADLQQIFQAPQKTLIDNTTSENVPYVIYTSGSTTKPRGAQFIDDGVVNFVSSMEQPGINSEDILLSLTTLSLDIAVLELLLLLTVGTQVVLLSRQFCT